MKMPKPLFELGKIVATPGALDLLERLGESPGKYIARHAAGDWGERLDQHDRDENRLALEKGDLRLFSAYGTRLGKLWVITEADRSSTCILTPDEY